jgi:hypothetical protein
MSIGTLAIVFGIYNDTYTQILVLGTNMRPQLGWAKSCGAPWTSPSSLDSGFSSLNLLQNLSPWNILHPQKRHF